jgi:hypothetical protein
MVSGSERTRRPVAWYTALAMAADTPMPISPRPLIPSAPPRRLDLLGSAARQRFLAIAAAFDLSGAPIGKSSLSISL